MMLSQIAVGIQKGLGRGKWGEAATGGKGLL